MPSPERPSFESEAARAERPPQPTESERPAEQRPRDGREFWRAEQLLREIQQLRDEEKDLRGIGPGTPSETGNIAVKEFPQTVENRLDHIPDEIAWREASLQEAAGDDELGRDIHTLARVTREQREVGADLRQIDAQIRAFTQEGDPSSADLLKKLRSDREAERADLGTTFSALNEKYKGFEAEAPPQETDTLAKADVSEIGLLFSREYGDPIADAKERTDVENFHTKEAQLYLDITNRLRSEGKLGKFGTYESAAGGVAEVGAAGRRLLTAESDPDVIALREVQKEREAYEAQLKEKYAAQLAKAKEDKLRDINFVSGYADIAERGKKAAEESKQRAAASDLEKTGAGRPPEIFEAAPHPMNEQATEVSPPPAEVISASIPERRVQSREPIAFENTIVSAPLRAPEGEINISTPEQAAPAVEKPKEQPKDERVEEGLKMIEKIFSDPDAPVPVGYENVRQQFKFFLDLQPTAVKKRLEQEYKKREAAEKIPEQPKDPQIVEGEKKLDALFPLHGDTSIDLSAVRAEFQKFSESLSPENAAALQQEFTRREMEYGAVLLDQAVKLERHLSTLERTQSIDGAQGTEEEVNPQLQAAWAAFDNYSKNLPQDVIGDLRFLEKVETDLWEEQKKRDAATEQIISGNGDQQALKTQRDKVEIELAKLRQKSVEIRKRWTKQTAKPAQAGGVSEKPAESGKDSGLAAAA